jgi:hypothetical protein
LVELKIYKNKNKKMRCLFYCVLSLPAAEENIKAVPYCTVT